MGDLNRPRRSTRQSKVLLSSPNHESNTTTNPSSSSKATKPRRTAVSVATAHQTANADPEQWLKSLLQNPKSILTTIDISEVLFNAGAWSMLSDDSRAELKELLPRTAFVGFKPSLGHDHPAATATASSSAAAPSSPSQESMEVDEPNNDVTSEVDASSLFTDPHFLAAARTFQDHIYSGWLSASHQEKVSKFESSLRDGTLAVPWKDEQWREENLAFEASPDLDSTTTTVPANGGGAGAANSLGRTASRILAGGAAQVKLTTLVEHGILQIGDILAYRRNFSTMNLTIEKDAIVDSIDPATHAITVLTVIGPSKALPESLLRPTPSNPLASNTAGTQNLAAAPGLDPGTPTPSSIPNVTSPTMLESGLLDIDGRIDKSQRPNGNAWKSMTVWRWRRGSSSLQGEMVNEEDVNGRGGRENYGTLFYLRGNYYHEEFQA